MIDNILQKLGFTVKDKGYRAYVETWREWYAGDVKNFHDYKIPTSTVPKIRKRASLRAAKQLCEYWASLLWNRDCYINADQRVLDALNDNYFYSRFTELTEVAFALGTGAVVVSERGGGVKLDFLPVESIYPLGGDDFAFVGKYGDGHYVQIHKKEFDTWTIYNRFADKSGVLISAPEDVAEEYRAGQKRFALIKPAVVNNLFNSQMGISVYANALDVLKSVDLAFDGAKTAMEIGRPRIGVTGNMLKTVQVGGDKTETRQVFDANDIAVYDMGQSDDGSISVKDLTTEYRADQFELSLQNQLNILSNAVGLGHNAFKWNSVGVSTATQVISENAAMLRTMEKHQSLIEDALQTIIHAVQEILGLPVETALIKFDDSVTRDRSAERERFWKFVVAGEFPFWKYLVEFEGYGEKDARAVAREREAARSVGEKI